MKICNIGKIITEKIDGSTLTHDNYISTENMMSNCGGVVAAASVPSTKVTCFAKCDVLLSNIRPYFKKVWFARFNGGCSNDVICINREAYVALKEDVRRARMYNEHAKFLGKYCLNTTDDLLRHEQTVEAQIAALCKERQTLRNKLRWMKDSEKMQPIREEIYAISAKIKPLRKEQKMCKDIYDRSTAVARTVEQIEFPKPPEKTKQQTRNRGWGSR